MAVSEAPVQHEHHYIEHDSSSGGLWVAFVVLALLVAFILFGSRFFGTRDNGASNGANVNGSVNIPSGGTDPGNGAY